MPKKELRRGRQQLPVQCCNLPQICPNKNIPPRKGGRCNDKMPKTYSRIAHRRAGLWTIAPRTLQNQSANTRCSNVRAILLRRPPVANKTWPKFHSIGANLDRCWLHLDQIWPTYLGPDWPNRFGGNPEPTQQLLRKVLVEQFWSKFGASDQKPAWRRQMLSISTPTPPLSLRAAPEQIVGFEMFGRYPQAAHHFLKKRAALCIRRRGGGVNS